MTAYILKASSISLFPAGAAPINLDGSHVNFEAVRMAIIEGDMDKAVELASVKTFMKSITGGLVEVSEVGVTYGGQPITGYLASKLTQFFKEGLPVAHYCRFLSNLMSNPSRTSVEELYLFLESADLPVTEDGCFMAYKAVRADFKDKHSGKFDNSPGKVLQMPRNQVDDVRDRTCSYGFHAAAYQYAKDFLGGYGDRMVAVKINPADVVSVPSDYQNQKLRTCRYEVMFEIAGRDDIFKDKAYWNTNPKGAEDVDFKDEDDYFDYGDEAADDDQF